MRWKEKNGRPRRWITWRRGHGVNKRMLQFFIPMSASLRFIRMGDGIVFPAPPRSSYLPPTTIKPLAATKQGLCLRVMVCLQEIKTGGVVGMRGRGRLLFCTSHLFLCSHVAVWKLASKGKLLGTQLWRVIAGLAGCCWLWHIHIEMTSFCII